MEKYFPRAISIEKLENKTAKILKKFGIVPKNTLLFSQGCCDELENRILKIFDEKWNFGFLNYGLAGLSSVGNTGMSAALSHVPDCGNMLLIYCSHIGITKCGKLGYVERRGIKKVNACCGSAISAYRNGEHAPDDHQQNYVVDIVNASRDLFTPDDEEKNMAILTKIICNQIGEDIRIPDIDTPVVILGGININMKHKDYFQVSQFGIQYRGKYLNLGKYFEV